MEIRIHPRRIAMVLFGVVLLLFVLNLLERLLLFLGRPAFILSPVSFAEGQNVATLFAVALLWLCALLTFTISRADTDRQRDSLQWMGLCVVFAVLGIEKATLLHTRLPWSIGAVCASSEALQCASILPMIILIGALAAFYMAFFFRLPTDTKRHLLFAGMVYICGVVVLDKAGCVWLSKVGQDLVYHLYVIFEETMEMVGCILFVYAFSNYIDRHLSGLSIRIDSAADHQ